MTPLYGTAAGIPTPPSVPLPPTPTAAPGAAQRLSFQEFMANSIQEVNSAQLQADHAVESLFTGDEVNPAEVLTAVKKADLAFRMLMQIRNKLVQAYEEVKNVRV